MKKIFKSALIVTSILININVYADNSSGSSVCQDGYSYVCDDLNVCSCVKSNSNSDVFVFTDADSKEKEAIEFTLLANNFDIYEIETFFKLESTDRLEKMGYDQEEIRAINSLLNSTVF